MLKEQTLKTDPVSDAEKNLKVTPDKTPVDQPLSYSPLPWSDYFDSTRTITLPDRDVPNLARTFVLYESGPRPNDSTASSSSSPPSLFVLHHGAGHGALAFALTADRLRKMTQGAIRILAYDARGHGDTFSSRQDTTLGDHPPVTKGDPSDYELTPARLAEDLSQIVVEVCQEYEPNGQPQVFLVGHSLGGSVAAEAASRGLIPNLVAFAVLDVLESQLPLALNGLGMMLQYRPKTLKSPEEAVQWSILSQTLRNVDSARVSFPALIYKDKDSSDYLWHTDLGNARDCWPKWFEGLNQRFLSPALPKLLILAEGNSLDKELQDAHRQGRYQLIVFENSGHAVQEDQPDRMAQDLLRFWNQVQDTA